MQDVTPKATLDFYQLVAQKLSGKEFKLLDCSPKTVIPISNLEIQSDPTKIYREIVSYIDPNNPPDFKFLLIDISGQYKGILRGQILTHLSSAIKWMSEFVQGLNVIVLVNELPSSEDVFLKGLDNLCQSKSILIVDSEGKYFPADANVPVDFALDYQSQIKTIRTDPMELLQRKLIRRLGHFKWYNENEEHIRCHRYFYDGTKCIPEIVELIKREIDDICQNEQKEISKIVVKAPFSPWLEEAASVTCESLSIEYVPLEKYVTSTSKKKDKKVLLIVDVVNTGDTVSKAFSDMKKSHPGVDINVVSILSTKADFSKQNLRTIKQQQQFTIKFFCKIESLQLKPTECPLCKLNIPKSSIFDEDYDILTTYDMWEMNDKARYIPERDVPKNRDPFEKVPDYTKMLGDYGSWIAFKLERLLDSQNLLNPDIVIVSPAELFPRSFSMYLKDIINIDAFIQIPKDQINRFTADDSSKKDLVNLIDSEKPVWASELRSSSQTKVVVLDEFHVSGGTIRGFEKVLNALDKNILCYIPVVDFNPKLSSTYQVKTLSLYEIQHALEDS